jgi:chromosome segregation ATPase
MLRPNSAVIALILCSGSLGCSKKVPECNALVKQLNDSSTALQSVTGPLTATPKQSKDALDKLAATTKTETEKLAKVELTLPELQGFSKNYQAFLKEMATSTQALAKANGDAESVQQAVTKGQTSMVSATSQLGVACAKAKRECATLDKTARPPSLSGARPADDAKKLDEYAKSVAAVELRNPDVKAAVEMMKKSAGEFADALRRASALQQELEKATKSMSEAGGKEPAIVKSINDFCQAG